MSCICAFIDCACYDDDDDVVIGVDVDVASLGNISISYIRDVSSSMASLCRTSFHVLKHQSGSKLLTHPDPPIAIPLGVFAYACTCDEMVDVDVEVDGDGDVVGIKLGRVRDCAACFTI